jgi:hypothetical protein
LAGDVGSGEASFSFGDDGSEASLNFGTGESDIFVSIIRILLDMLRKTNDRLKSHTDLVQFELRPELHLILRPNGNHLLPPASYTLTVEEKKGILPMPAWGASTNRLLVQHQQTSLNE